MQYRTHVDAWLRLHKLGLQRRDLSTINSKYEDRTSRVGMKIGVKSVRTPDFDGSKQTVEADD